MRLSVRVRASRRHRLVRAYRGDARGDGVIPSTHANEVVLLLMRSANEYRARHRGEYEYDKAGRRAGAAASALEDPWWTCSDRFRGWVGALVDATHTALAELRDRRGGDARGHADDDTLDRTLGRQLAGLIDATLSGACMARVAQLCSVVCSGGRRALGVG